MVGCRGANQSLYQTKYQLRGGFNKQAQNLCIAAQSWTKLGKVEQSLAILSKVEQHLANLKQANQCWGWEKLRKVEQRRIKLTKVE